MAWSQPGERAERRVWGGAKQNVYTKPVLNRNSGKGMLTQVVRQGLASTPQCATVGWVLLWCPQGCMGGVQSQGAEACGVAVLVWSVGQWRHSGPSAFPTVLPSPCSPAGVGSVSHHHSSPLFPDSLAQPTSLPLLPQMYLLLPPTQAHFPWQGVHVPCEPVQSPDHRPHYCLYPWAWDMAETCTSASWVVRNLLEGWSCVCSGLGPLHLAQKHI